MKKLTLISILAGSLVFSGCGTFQGTPAEQQQMSCNAAQTAYLIYLSYINAGKEPSKDQILLAQSAAIILTQNCGWKPPETPQTLTRGNIDKRGVIILVPPAW